MSARRDPLIGFFVMHEKDFTGFLIQRNELDTKMRQGVFFPRNPTLFDARLKTLPGRIIAAEITRNKRYPGRRLRGGGGHSFYLGW